MSQLGIPLFPFLLTILIIFSRHIPPRTLVLVPVPVAYFHVRFQQVVFTFRMSELDSTGLSSHESVLGKPPSLPRILFGETQAVYLKEHKTNLPFPVLFCRYSANRRQSCPQITVKSPVFRFFCG
jgi:hypothetical protein